MPASPKTKYKIAKEKREKLCIEVERLFNTSTAKTPKPPTSYDVPLNGIIWASVRIISTTDLVQVDVRGLTKAEIKFLLEVVKSLGYEPKW